MLSQHEADTLAEALIVLGNLSDAAKGEAFGAGLKSDETFWLGRFAGSCIAARASVHEVLVDAAGLLDDEKARDALGAS